MRKYCNDVEALRCFTSSAKVRGSDSNDGNRPSLIGFTEWPIRRSRFFVSTKKQKQKKRYLCVSNQLTFGLIIILIKIELKVNSIHAVSQPIDTNIPAACWYILDTAAVAVGAPPVP